MKRILLFLATNLAIMLLLTTICLLSMPGIRSRHHDLFEASRDSNADDEHDPEGQTIAYERSQLAAITAQTRDRLDEVEAALERVSDGTYGRCEVCGEPIPLARLEARPAARTCVRHAETRR